MIRIRERYVSGVIEGLELQREKARVLLDDAVQDYIDAMEDDDMDARTEALGEAECYAAASTAIAKAIDYLKKAREGKHD